MEPTIHCPYSNTELSSPSEEHVIPLSVGGVNGFVITVNEQYNADANDKADAPFMNTPLVLWLRMRGKVRENRAKGDFSKYETSIPVEIEGYSTTLNLIIDENGVAPRFPFVVVERDKHGNSVIVGLGDEDELQRALERYGRETAAASARKDPPDQGKQRVSNFDLAATKIIPMTRMSMLITEAIQETIIRFCAKVALGAVFWKFGNPWSTSTYAENLRQYVFRNGSRPANISIAMRPNLAVQPTHHKVTFIPKNGKIVFSLDLFETIAFIAEFEGQLLTLEQEESYRIDWNSKTISQIH